jgi:hypothetical protein
MIDVYMYVGVAVVDGGGRRDRSLLPFDRALDRCRSWFVACPKDAVEARDPSWKWTMESKEL